MSVRTDYLNLVVNVNGNAAKKDYYDLKAKAAELNKEIQGLKKGTKEYIDKTKELQDVNARIDSMRGKMDLTSLSIKDLRKELQSMKAVRDTLDPASEAFKNLSERISVADSRLKNLQGTTSLSEKAFNFLKKEVMAFGMVALTALGVDYLIGKLGNIIQRNAELSDSFADVARYTNLTDEDVKKLSSNLSKIDTRTSRKELLSLAGDAGKLGISGKENIEAFVKSADQIKVALGEDLGKDAIIQLTKLNNVFKISETYGMSAAEALTHTGSVVNKLGAESAAAEAYLVDFMTRLGPVASQAGLTITQLAGLASTSDELGLSAEVTATVFNQVLPKMYSDTAAYAKVAKMSVAEFSTLLKEDANAAMIAFLEGLKGNNEGMGEMAQKLKDVEIDGTRGIAVLAALSENTTRLKEAQASANEEFASGQSIVDEFNKRNSNLAANIEKLKKELASLTATSKLQGVLEDSVSAMLKYVRSIKETNSESNILKTTIEASKVAWNDTINLYGQIADTLKPISRLVKNIAVQLGLMNDEMSMLDFIFSSLIKGATQIFKPLTDLLLIIEKIFQGVNGVIEVFKNLSTILPDLFSDIKNSVEEAFIPDGNSIFTKIKKALSSPFKKLGSEIKKAFNEGWTGEPNPESITNIPKNTPDQWADENPYGIKENKAVIATNNKTTGSNSNAITITETDKKAEEARKKAEEAYAELKKHIAEMEREALLSTLSANQKELEAIYDKYQKEIVAAKGHKEEIAKLERLRDAEYFATLEKQKKEEADKKNKAYQSFINDYEAFKEKEWEANLTAREKEEVAVMQMYDSMAEKTMEALKNKVITQEQHDEIMQGLAIQQAEHLKMLREKFLAEDQLAQTEHLKKLAEFYKKLADNPFEEGNPYDAERARIKAHYDALLAEAKLFFDKKIMDEKAYNETSEKINKQRADANTAVDKKEVVDRIAAQVQGYNALASQTSGFINMLTAENQKYTKAQKAATLLQLSMDTASAISSLVKYSQQNPLNAPTFGAAGIATFASGLVQIMTNVGMAMKVLTSGTVPAGAQSVNQKAEGGYTTVQGADDRENYRAKMLPRFENGFLNNPSLVLAGEKGPEYFVNNDMLQNPDVAKIVAGIEALSRGRISQVDFSQMLSMPAMQQKASGGYTAPSFSTSTVSPVTISNDTMLLMVAESLAKLNKHLDDGITSNAYIGDPTIIEFQKRQSYLSNIEKEAN